MARSYSTYWFLPRDFASYIARSALRSMLSAVSLLSPKATPMLADSESWWPATWAPRDSDGEDPLAGGADLGRVHVLEQQRELVTAEPGDGVALPDAAAQPLGDVDRAPRRRRRDRTGR